jgi:phosphoserine phosphatase RsbU/P
MPPRLKSLYNKLGRIDKIFIVLLVLAWAASYAVPGSGWSILLAFAAWITGFVVIIRLARTGIRRLIWRLRNRLIVAYLFIAVVPIALILALAAASIYTLTGQIGTYLVNSELDRRTNMLRGAATAIAESAPPRRAEIIARTRAWMESLFPAIEVLVHDGGEQRFPPSASIGAPPAGWKDTSGIVVKDRALYSWAHVTAGDTGVVILAPLSDQFLSALVPGLGSVDFVLSESGARRRQRAAGGGSLPPKSNFLDIQALGGAPVPAMLWKSPGHTENVFLLVRTRLSAVLGILFGTNVVIGDMPYGQFFWWAFLVTAGLFLIVELVALVIGVSITRTVTGAVHELYLGTRHVKEGDFSHRILVRGNDQLAELGASFNTMTENLKNLIVVAKEKERLQSELEIAREVQGQLFPKDVADLKTLQVTGVCNAARVVSGDYYDFIRLADSRMAFAIGDVAGKGISAALLMAAIQSTMRIQLTSELPAVAAAGNGGSRPRFSTAAMVSRLNKQLYANTAPEKFATFYFGLYEEETNMLTYTNAGHLPPILLHNSGAELLQVTGTVVGAFPSSRYGEQQLQLSSGDVLVAYTDGIVEPENEYGEMFGEQRLIDLLARNRERDSHEIIANVMEAVQQWSGQSAELQDDMTILVARRV